MRCCFKLLKTMLSLLSVSGFLILPAVSQTPKYLFTVSRAEIRPYRDYVAFLVHPNPLRFYFITYSDSGHPKEVIVVDGKGHVIAKHSFAQLLNLASFYPMSISADIDSKGDLYYVVDSENDKHEINYHAFVITKDGTYDPVRSHHLQVLFQRIGAQPPCGGGYRYQCFRILADDSIAVMCMDQEESKVTLLRYQFAGSDWKAMGVQKEIPLRGAHEHSELYEYLKSIIITLDGSLWICETLFRIQDKKLIKEYSKIYPLDNPTLTLRYDDQSPLLPLTGRFTGVRHRFDLPGVLSNQIYPDIRIDLNNKFYLGIEWESRLEKALTVLPKRENPDEILRIFVNCYAICRIDPATKQAAVLAYLEAAVDIFPSGETDILYPLWTIDRLGNIYYLQRGKEKGVTELWMVPAGGSGASSKPSAPSKRRGNRR